MLIHDEATSLVQAVFSDDIEIDMCVYLERERERESAMSYETTLLLFVFLFRMEKVVRGREGLCVQVYWREETSFLGMDRHHP